MAMALVDCGRGAAVLMLLAACTQRDSTDLEPIVSGGAGGAAAGAAGSSQELAGAGGADASAGAAGAGGALEPDLPDGGPARFRAVLQGETVTLSALQPVWLETCERNPRLVQRSGDSWTLLRDERPEDLGLNYAAHYLDGVYHSDCALSLGCDVASCEPLPDRYSRLVAHEYVQVGQLEALRCDALDSGVELDAGSDAGIRLVPSLETRAPSGPLGVRVRYFLDPCQSAPLTEDVAVE